MTRSRLTGGRADALGTYVLLVVSLGLGFASQLMVARLTGVTGYGTYAFALAWAGMATRPALLGLDRVVVRELASYRRAQALGHMRGLLRRANQIAALSALVITVIVAAIALPLASDAERVSVALGLLTIPLTALGLVRRAALQGLRHAFLGAATHQVGRTLLFIAFLGVAVLVAGPDNLDPEVAVGMQLLAFTAALLLSAIAVRQVLPRGVRRSTPQYDGPKWRAGLPHLAALTGLNLVNAQIGVVMLGAMASPAATGRFNAASRTAALVSLALGAVGSVMAPRVSELAASGDRPGLEQLLRKSSAAAFALAVPTALFLVAAGPWLLGWFGPAFRSGNRALTILVSGQLVNAATGSLGVVLVMTRNERSATRAALVSTCLNIVLCLVLIPAWGTDGAAAAATVGVLVVNGMYLLAVVRKVGITPTLCGIRMPIRR